MTRALALLLALGAGAAFAADAPQPRATSSCTGGNAAIKQALQSLIAADNRGDLDAVLSHYADDAWWLPPSGPRVEGKAAIAARYRELFAANRVEFVVEGVGTELTSALAWATGETRGTVTPKDGGAPRAVHDEFVALFRCESGRYRVVGLSWRPAEPPPAR